MKNDLIIMFSGDVCFCGNFRKAFHQASDIFQSQLSNLLKQSDFHVTNLEGPIVEAETDDIHSLTNPAGIISYLKKHHIDVYNVANNHMFDLKNAGWLTTHDELKNEGVKFLGAGNDLDEASKVLYLSKKDVKVGLISICAYSNDYADYEQSGTFSSSKKKLLNQKITESKSEADYTGIIFHGGEEYSFFPSPQKRHFLRSLAAKHKPDFIVSHHSHTLQGMEQIGKCIVFYSLGNFIFDYPPHRQFDGTESGGLLQLHFTKQGIHHNLHLITINRDIATISVTKNDAYLHKICNFSNYHKKWQREAYRVITERKEILPNTEKSLKNEPVSKLLISKRFYARILTIVGSKNLRTRYFAAFIHYLRSKINRDKH